MSPGWILLQLRMTEVVVTTGARRRPKLQIVTTNITPNFLHAAHLSCRPTNSIRAQKENKNTILLYTYKKKQSGAQFQAHRKCRYSSPGTLVRSNETRSDTTLMVSRVCQCDIGCLATDSSPPLVLVYTYQYTQYIMH